MRHSKHTRVKLGTYVLGSEQDFASLREDWEICSQEYPQIMASLEWPNQMSGVMKVTMYGITHMTEVFTESEAESLRDEDVGELLNDAPGG